MNEIIIKNFIEQLKLKIKMYVRHRTLHKYTGDPNVHESRLFFLILPFLNGEDWTEEHEQSVIAVAVIYSALTAHDQIKELNASSKSQQLTVLAGDYYSGLYYQLLAKLSNIELIRSLSSGIVDISEKKSSVYDQIHRTFEEWMDTLQTIESLSIEQFYQHFGFDMYQSFVRRALFIERISHELNLFDQGKTSRFQESLAESASMLGYKTNWHALLERRMEEEKQHLLNEISSFSFPDSIKKYMKQLLDMNKSVNASVIRER
ncbi:MAG: heptaprenyl diphosphate synthase component 1 [Paenisporosarcina sp.]